MATEAELKAKLALNIGPFKQAISEAKREAKEFTKQVSEIGSDLGKSLTGFDLGKAMKVGGAVYAAGLVGEALVDAAKEGLEAFQDFEKEVLRIQLNVKGATKETATAMMEATEQQAGAAGSASDIASVQLALRQAGLKEKPEDGDQANKPENAGGVGGATSVTKDGQQYVTLPQKETPPEAGPNAHNVQDFSKVLENYAIQSGKPLKELGESFAKIVERGGDTGDNISKVLTQIPDLGKQIRGEQEAAYAVWYNKLSEFEKAHPSKDQAEHGAKLQSQSPANYFKEHGGSANDLMDRITKMTDMTAVDKFKDTLAGQMQELAAKFHLMSVALGEGIAPEVKKVVQDLITMLPALTETLKVSLGGLAKFIDDTFHKTTAAGAQSTSDEISDLNTGKRTRSGDVDEKGYGPDVHSAMEMWSAQLESWLEKVVLKMPGADLDAYTRTNAKLGNIGMDPTKFDALITATNEQTTEIKKLTLDVK